MSYFCFIVDCYLNQKNSTSTSIGLSTTRIVIQDQLNVIHTDQLYNEFVKFQQLTGITPAFESISHSTDGDSLEKYAEESYNRTFKDQKHCLFVYGEMKITNKSY